MENNEIMKVEMNRREFLVNSIGTVGALALASKFVYEKPREKRPNILIALADDWSWPHASIAGDKSR